MIGARARTSARARFPNMSSLARDPIFITRTRVSGVRVHPTRWVLNRRESRGESAAFKRDVRDTYSISFQKADTCASLGIQGSRGHFELDLQRRFNDGTITARSRRIRM